MYVHCNGEIGKKTVCIHHCFIPYDHIFAYWFVYMNCLHHYTVYVFAFVIVEYATLHILYFIKTI